jgi:hypothetical protein
MLLLFKLKNVDDFLLPTPSTLLPTPPFPVNGLNSVLRGNTFLMTFWYLLDSFQPASTFISLAPLIYSRYLNATPFMLTPILPHGNVAS